MIMLGKLQNKWFGLAISILFGLLWGYTFSVRFTGFIGAARMEKISLLGITSISFAAVTFFIYTRLLPRFSGRFSQKSILALVGISSLLAFILLFIFYRLPPFPETHTLQITVLDNRNPLSDANWVHILSIERVNLPSGEKIPIYSTQYNLDGDWKIKSDRMLLWDGGQAGRLIFQSFIQSGIKVVFETSPARGMVEINWDGSEQIFDLYNQYLAERTVWLPPPLNWEKADNIRKMLLGTAFFGELLALTVFLIILGWYGAHLRDRGLKIDHPGLLAGGACILIILFLVNLEVLRPVKFDDPNLEDAVQQALNRYDQPIFQYQLLTVAKLDASGREITSLEGIEHLSNLTELNLQDNQIEDITPLAELKKLSSLNLRNNEVQELTPLSGLTKLNYLNLHSNYNITSLEPLQRNTILESLILSNVPIGSQLTFLKQFSHLTHLNLRNTGTSDISVLSGLSDLVYLNLHSNPEINDITPLASLSRLQTLILENVPVANQINVLKNFDHLSRLNLSNTGITDTSILAGLMSHGSLQDDPANGIMAEINLGGNPIDINTTDHYAPIRPYWNYIARRVPFKLPDYISLLPSSFSHPAGFYNTGFFLVISTDYPSSTIHYTLDGSEPNRDSPKYVDPIQIDSRIGEPSSISNIGDISPYWLAPDEEVFKATVVRAKVFGDNEDQTSPTITHTYFVDQAIQNRYTLPIVSLVTDAGYLFNYKDGMYVKGQYYDLFFQPELNNSLLKQDANYQQHGEIWERPVHVEFFEPGGNGGFSLDGAFRIHGNATRGFPEKSLRIYPQSREDLQIDFSYELFPGLSNRADNLTITQFNNFLLQNFGNDWLKALIRDPLMHDLVSHTSIDTQAYRPVIVFINGEYWGIHNLRQRVDEYYLSETYQIDPGKVVILDDDQVLVRGNPGDDVSYKSMLDLIQDNDIRKENIYAQVNNQMDIDNFINYQVAEIYSANTDWPDSNLRYWRFKTDSPNLNAAPGMDGRWRWILFDVDHGFGYEDQYDSYEHRTLEVAEQIEYDGFLFSSLLKNEAFQIQFINSMADHLNTSFREERVVERINQMHALLQPVVEEHIHRWRTMGDSFYVWEQNVGDLREFALKRPDQIRRQLIERFGLLGLAELAVETDSTKGYIRINSIDITEDTPGVNNPDSWSGIYFMGNLIQVSAVPLPGFRFSRWEGIHQTDSSFTTELTGDLTLKAIFLESP